MSLSPLREALARLVSDGLAEFEDNRGYRVAPVSLENLAEVTQLRTEFECSALRHAMTVGDVDWEADVMRDLYRLSQITRDPAHPETLAHWEAAHAEFRMTLIAGCNMPLLQNTCSHGDAGSAAALGACRLSVCGDDPEQSRLVANFAGLCDLAAEFGIGVDLECMAWRQYPACRWP